MDGYLRMWHKDDKFQPLFIRNFKGDIKDVQWDPKGLGFFMVNQIIYININEHLQILHQ